MENPKNIITPNFKSKGYESVNPVALLPKCMSLNDFHLDNRNPFLDSHNEKELPQSSKKKRKIKKQHIDHWHINKEYREEIASFSSHNEDHINCTNQKYISENEFFNDASITNTSLIYSESIGTKKKVQKYEKNQYKAKCGFTNSMEKPNRSHNSSSKNRKRKKNSNSFIQYSLLDQQAFLLWFSEQYFECSQLHPYDTHQELQERKKPEWQELESRRKAFYYLRAQNASRDEYKHSYTDTPTETQMNTHNDGTKECLENQKKQNIMNKEDDNSLFISHPEQQIHWNNQFMNYHNQKASSVFNLNSARISSTDFWQQKPKDMQCKCKENLTMKESFHEQNFNWIVQKLILGQYVNFPSNVYSEQLSLTLTLLAELEASGALAVG
ncbi:uncharacterized protein LOC106881721 isoform X1 [Octopus bimaculoides]|uniref:Uncharacterized protein n=1 Tax=Octopus bimaculoides TaxID=37653 RepID=A0A0L8FR40_OCTBM|nr:uncharacterized protein LOC106881721 isoform X1 [Octopus bimaculoides]|eukprot:XP_014787688.1 PREDICTED: uncharacterized protein LOC106881721 isoform X1 [Octopus bimaculoides]